MAIEYISEEHCSNCGKCVLYCPMDVFRANSVAERPDIAFPADCQSCLICEVYCPEDAIYVSPKRARPSPLPW